MRGSLEYGAGLRMRGRIGPILTTTTMTAGGLTMKGTGIMRTTVTTTTGVTAKTLPGARPQGRALPTF